MSTLNRQPCSHGDVAMPTLPASYAMASPDAANGKRKEPPPSTAAPNATRPSACSQTERLSRAKAGVGTSLLNPPDAGRVPVRGAMMLITEPQPGVVPREGPAFPVTGHVSLSPAPLPIGALIGKPQCETGMRSPTHCDASPVPGRARQGRERHRCGAEVRNTDGTGPLRNTWCVLESWVWGRVNYRAGMSWCFKLFSPSLELGWSLLLVLATSGQARLSV